MAKKYEFYSVERVGKVVGIASTEKEALSIARDIKKKI